MNRRHFLQAAAMGTAVGA
ncbi:MAG: hypothetical protein DMG93_01635, partial [Acidobacteria bacterium]